MHMIRTCVGSSLRGKSTFPEFFDVFRRCIRDRHEKSSKKLSNAVHLVRNSLQFLSRFFFFAGWGERPLILFRRTPTQKVIPVDVVSI